MARQRDTTANNAPPAAPQTDSPVFSPISGTLRLVWKCVVWLFLSVVIGTVLDWLGMLAGWWGPDHSLTVLSQDIAWLGEHFTTSILGRSRQRSRSPSAAPSTITSPSRCTRRHATVPSSRSPSKPRSPYSRTGRASFSRR